jgi:hypothetical protein
MHLSRMSGPTSMAFTTTRYMDSAWSVWILMCMSRFMRSYHLSSPLTGRIRRDFQRMGPNSTQTSIEVPRSMWLNSEPASRSKRSTNASSGMLGMSRFRATWLMRAFSVFSLKFASRCTSMRPR